mgnify:CR=1 FL=1
MNKSSKPDKLFKKSQPSEIETINEELQKYKEQIIIYNNWKKQQKINKLKKIKILQLYEKTKK